MDSNFDDRLKRAISRGTSRAEERFEKERAKALTEEELKQLHGKYRLQISDHIEKCVQRLPLHFPGFRSEMIFGERGWGAACSRDDFAVSGKSQRKRSSVYSRLEVFVRPFSSLHVVELVAKGTVRNKEIFNRSHFKKIPETDVSEFQRLVDAWVIEFAELYAAAIGG